MRTLYVGGLPPETDASWLRTLFARFGELASARVVRHRAYGTDLGFGYVTFRNENAAIEARRELDGSELAGARLRVAVAR